MKIYGILSNLILSVIFIINDVQSYKIFRKNINFSFQPKSCKRHVKLNTIYSYYEPDDDDKKDITKGNVDNDSGDDESDSSQSLLDRERDNIESNLRDLINKQYEIEQASNTRDNIEKYDWFSDEPFDSSDEEFAREYCEIVKPDVKSIYKMLDPYGLKEYLPKNMTIADKTLGRVYDVGKPINEFVDNNNLYEHEDTNITIQDKHKIIEPVDTNMVVDDYTPEINHEDIEDIDSDDVVLEDELCRYFVKLPTIKWTNLEGVGYNKAMDKYKRCSDYYKQQQCDNNVTDIRTVFNSPPQSEIGIKGNDLHNNVDTQEDTKICDNNNSTYDIKYDYADSSKLHELYIKEYRHSDLLNDIDSYVSKEYPKIILDLVKEDAEKPIFTLNNIVDNKSMIDKELPVDTTIYIGIPKIIIKDDVEDSTIVNHSLFTRRNYMESIGKVINEIPIVDGCKTGILLLPNEAGFMDQNTRYLVDELSIHTASLVFVPDISDNPTIYKISLNRIIKFMQLGFNIDRICIVALGNQGYKVINYLHEMMSGLVSLYRRQLDLDDDVLKYKRIKELLNKQSLNMIDDIINGIQTAKLKQSALAANRARDYNVIKPLANIIQSIILFDVRNINFKKLVEISTPIMLLQSNTNKIFDNFLTLYDNKDFMKARKKTFSRHIIRPVDVFQYCNENKPVNLDEIIKDVRFEYLPKDEECKDDIDQFHILTKNSGVDITVNIYRKGTGYYYMKKPTANKDEMEVIGDSIINCANWIRSWTY